jgi:hypothetical protein
VRDGGVELGEGRAREGAEGEPGDGGCRFEASEAVEQSREDAENEFTYSKPDKAVADLSSTTLRRCAGRLRYTGATPRQAIQSLV